MAYWIIYDINFITKIYQFR